MKSKRSRLASTLAIILRTAIISAVVLIVEHHVAVDGALTDLAWTYRRDFNSAAQPKSPIAVVMLDDSVIRDEPIRNPYPREILRKILVELNRAKPACIVLDAFLVDEFVPERDGSLAEEIRRCGNVYLAIPVAPAEGGHLSLIRPASEFMAAAKGSGVSAFSASGDGRVRAFKGEIEVQEVEAPHLISSVTKGLDGAEVKGEHVLDYGIRPEQAMHFISARDLIYPEDSGLNVMSPAEHIAGNVVIVGPYDSYSPDLFASPNDSWKSGVIRGSELLAMGLQTVRSPHAPTEIGEPLAYLLALAFYVLGWLAQNFVRGRYTGWRLLAGGLAILGLIGIGWRVGELGPFAGLCAIASIYLASLALLFHSEHRRKRLSVRAFGHVSRWLFVLLFLLSVVALGAYAGLIFPVSLVVAGWILGWEAGELYVFESEEAREHELVAAQAN